MSTMMTSARSASLAVELFCFPGNSLNQDLTVARKGVISNRCYPSKLTIHLSRFIPPNALCAFAVVDGISLETAQASPSYPRFANTDLLLKDVRDRSMRVEIIRKPQAVDLFLGLFFLCHVSRCLGRHAGAPLQPRGLPINLHHREQ